MKKTIAMLLLVSMAAALCACGVITPGSTDNNTANTEAVTEGTDGSDNFYSLNFAEGNTYRNRHFGFGFTPDDGWTFASEEEILEQNNLTSGMLDEELQQQINNASLIYDMSATNEDGLESVIVNVENPGPGGLLMTEENYLTSQTDLIKDTLEDLGYTDINITVVDIPFAGGTHSAVKISAVYDTNVWDEIIVVVKNGTKFANISVSSYLGNTDKILANFYAVN